jgi:hypothetical protein
VLESSVENHLVKRIRGLGGMCLKWVCPSMRGAPDRIVLLPYRQPMFIELKSPTGRLRKDQKRMHIRLDDLGMYVKTLHSKAEVDAWIKEVTGD